MASFRHEQHRVSHRGHDFHFISYEATAANPARQVAARPETWFLVSSGNRWPAIPCVPDQAPEQLDAELIAWLEAAVFTGATVV